MDPEKIVELKAEAFDLLVRKEQTVKAIDSRLNEIYSKLNQAEDEAKSIDGGAIQ